MVEIGEGVFETLKVIGSEPCALTRHLARMRHSARVLGMPIPDDSSIRTAVSDHLSAEHRELARLRITWTLGTDGGELALASEPMAPPSSSATLTYDTWTVDENGIRAGIKSTRYEGFAAARARATSAGFDDAIVTNTSGQVCETSTANVFYVLDGTLRTPPLASGCLPGIARGLVIDLCDVLEVDTTLEDLAHATEVFITSSLREVQPVSRIGDRSYPTGGSRTAEAMEAWRELAAVTLDPAPADSQR